MSASKLPYYGSKLQLAEDLIKQAKLYRISPRTIAGCISTTEKSIQFDKRNAERLQLPNVADIKVNELQVSLKETAKAVLSEKSSADLLKPLLPTEKLAIDFSSPNIAKPFHVGHLNSTILGNYIANLKKYLGDEVTRINYLGDWGTQFGILCAAYERFGSDELLAQDPLNHLVDVYVKGNQLAAEDEAFKKEALDNFAKLEANDKQIRERWWTFRDISLKEYFKIYAKLGIRFDVIQGESAFHKDANDLVEELKAKKIVENEDGIWGIRGEKGAFLPLVKSNGSTLYLTRDICAAIARKKQFEVDSLYYCVDNAQTKHFQDLAYCLSSLQRTDIKTVHVKFGRITGLSTRKGQVVLLEDLIEEATQRAFKSLEEATTTRVSSEDYQKTASQLGLSAIFVNTMRSRRKKGSTFEWEKCFSLKGDSGISLQYSHARLCSLREINAEVEPQFHEDAIHDILQDANARESILRLAHFQEHLLRSDAQLEPCELVQYLFKLGHDIGRTLKTQKIKDEQSRLAETRRLLFVRLEETLNEGLRLLGVKPLTQM